MAEDEPVAQFKSLQRVRQIIVFIALGMLILSIVFKMHFLAWPRAFAWAVAAGVSVMEGRALTKLGQPAGSSYVNAAIYAVVAVFPLLRGN